MVENEQEVQRITEAAAPMVSEVIEVVARESIGRRPEAEGT